MQQKSIKAPGGKRSAMSAPGATFCIKTAQGSHARSPSASCRQGFLYVGISSTEHRHIVTCEHETVCVTLPSGSMFHRAQFIMIPGPRYPANVRPQRLCKSADLFRKASFGS